MFANAIEGDVHAIDSLAQTLVLVRPQPLEGESWAGYLMRLSARNGFSGIQDIAQILGVSVQRLLVDDSAVTLRALGIVWSSQSATKANAAKEKSRRNMYQQGKGLRFKFCPACLANDEIPFIRAEWEGLIRFTCLHHGTVLCDACSICGLSPSARQELHTHCACGEPYASQACAEAPTFLMTMQMILFEAYPAIMKETFARYSSAELHGFNCLKWALSVVIPSSSIEDDANSRRTRYPIRFEEIRKLAFLFDDFWGGMDQLALKIREKNPNTQSSYFVKRFHADFFLAMRLLERRISAGKRHTGAVFAISVDGVPAVSVSASQSGRSSGFQGTQYAYAHTDAVDVESSEDGCSKALRFIDSSNVKTWGGILKCSGSTLAHLARNDHLALDHYPHDVPHSRISATDIDELFLKFQSWSIRNTDIAASKRTYFDDIARKAFQFDVDPDWDKAFAAIRDGRLELFSTTKAPMSFDQLYVCTDALHEVQRSA